MQNELTKRFIKDEMRKVILFVSLMSVIAILSQPIRLILTNELALGQMQASNEAFIAMQTVNKIQSICKTAYVGAILWFIGMIACDTYKFVKTITTGKEKEN